MSFPFTLVFRAYYLEHIATLLHLNKPDTDGTPRPEKDEEQEPELDVEQEEELEEKPLVEAAAAAQLVETLADLHLNKPDTDGTPRPEKDEEQEPELDVEQEEELEEKPLVEAAAAAQLVETLADSVQKIADRFFDSIRHQLATETAVDDDAADDEARMLQTLLAPIQESLPEPVNTNDFHLFFVPFSSSQPFHLISHRRSNWKKKKSTLIRL